MPDPRIILGKIFVLRPVIQICGKVDDVFYQECGTLRNSSVPRLFPKNFYLFKIVEPANRKKRPRDRMTAVLLDNNDIPKTAITGENSVIGKNIIIESHRAIVTEDLKNRVPDRPRHRLLKGTFLVLRPFTKILGLVTDVVTEEKRQNARPSTNLFDEGFYFMRIVEEAEDLGPKVRRETSIIVDRNIIPPSTVTGENSIVGKIVALEPDRIIVSNMLV